MRLLFILLLTAGTVHAETVRRWVDVVDVTDGDTVKIRVNNQIDKIRLAWIDAPESDQDHGAAAARHLEDEILDQRLMMIAWDRDRYDRLLGELITRGGVSVNRQLVTDCYAWHWPRYAPDDIQLANAQRSCELKHKGIWRNPTCPVEPWRWRQGARTTTHCKNRKAESTRKIKETLKELSSK